MAEETTMEKKLSFTLKDMIYIVVILVSILGNYYSTDTRLILAERDVLEIKKQLGSYEGLPVKVDNIEIQVNKNAKLTEAIYLGLVAKGFIKPKSL